MQKINLYTSNKNLEDIDCFNIEEEIKRKEDWITSNEEINNHTNILLYGGTYGENKYNGLINESLSGSPKFVEEIGKSIVEGKEKTFIYYTII